MWPDKSDIVCQLQNRDSNQDMGSGGRLPNAEGARKIAVTLAEAIDPLLGSAR